MWPFGARLPIDRDELDFQLATFKWLIAQFGPVGDRPLIVPAEAFFPPAMLRGRAGPREVFEAVRGHAGMADWPCALEAGASDRPIDAGNAHLIRHGGGSAPCGTFRIGEGLAGRHAIISYTPDMAGDPAGLVATFAHELGHYLMATAAADPPGGWDLHELHTDLAAVYLGFGTFLANHARAFSHFGTAAGPYLKPYLAGVLGKADKALRRQAPDMAATVAAVDLGEFA
jgi:hypothetical protein